MSKPIISTLCTKSLTQVLPSCSISMLVLSGYFSVLFGALMISLGGAMVYQALQPNSLQKSPETLVASSRQTHTI